MDSQASSVSYLPQQLEHRYGQHIHILNHPLACSLLAKLCAKSTEQPEISRLVVELYRILLCEAVSAEFPRTISNVYTRMIDETPKGIWTGEILDLSIKCVVVSLARAGILPSQLSYDFLNQTLNPKLVRQDHLVLSRSLSHEGKVTGATLYSSKIGGSIDHAFLLIPDPMGATGSTVGQVLDHYHEGGYGSPRKVLALHLIVTPEYLKFIRENYPHVIVYALRLDRGLSSEEILSSIPGTFWEKERGLTDHQYIVPGAGGLGEVLNNSFV